MAFQGPPPTRLVALSGLPTMKWGEKVRFLGCITKYDRSTGVVTLQHDYPIGNGHEVLVDVNLLLESLDSSQTRLGEWMNVMGYVTSKGPSRTTGPYWDCDHTTVQAIVFWSAGPVRLDEYEKALFEQDCS